MSPKYSPEKERKFYEVYQDLFYVNPNVGLKPKQPHTSS